MHQEQHLEKMVNTNASATVSRPLRDSEYEMVPWDDRAHQVSGESADRRSDENLNDSQLEKAEVESFTKKDCG